MRKAVARRHRKVANEPHPSGNGQARGSAQPDRDRGPVDRQHDRLGGTVEKPGTSVAAKAGLNPAIPNPAPGSFLSVLCIKAEEGHLAGAAKGIARRDVSELPEWSEKTLSRTRAPMWLRLPGNTAGSHGSFDAR
jgi:hypothetical protein